MRKALLILSLSLTLIGCAALGRGWNDDQIRNDAAEQGRRFRDFVTAVTGYGVAGTVGGSAAGFLVLLVRGWKKKDA